MKSLIASFNYWKRVMFPKDSIDEKMTKIFLRMFWKRINNQYALDELHTEILNEILNR